MASVVTTYQTAATVSLRCSDSDGDPVATSIVTLPGHGTLQAGDAASGTVIYTPQARYTGTDSFVFTASDGTNASGPATATITVQPSQAAPPQPTPPPRTTPPRVPARLLLTALRQSATRWREVRSEPRHDPTTFSFTLNEAARVTLTFSRNMSGRRVGTLTVKGRRGHNRIAFSGRLPRGGWLPRGRITVTAVAATAGHRSPARRLSFVIVAVR
jgi:hypothetical protein